MTNRRLSALAAGLLLAACGAPAAPVPPPAPVTVTAPAAPTVEAAPAGAAAEEPVRRGPAALINVDPGRSIAAREQLLAATSQGAPDRPGILWRLAGAYAEVAAGADRNGPAGEAAARAARRRAIDHYTTLAAEYPRFCAGNDRGCGDEVLFYLAHEHEQAREREQALNRYREMIKGWPQSRYLPSAYLALAEALFDEALSDASKLPAAEQAYQAVLRFPPPDNKVAGQAHHKLGTLRWNRGDTAGALAEMTQALAFAVHYPQLPGAPQLARESRRDLVSIYAAGGDPARAYELLAARSGDAPGERTQLHPMLEALAQAYLGAGKPDAAAQVYVDWLSHGAGASPCAVVRGIDAVLAHAGGSPAGRARAQALARASAPLVKARAECAAAP